MRWRNRIAARAARNRGETYFRKNPDRVFMVRATFPLEQEGWTGGEHVANPLTLCIRHHRDTPKHNVVAFSGDPAAVPNDEAFLSELWDHMRAAHSLGHGGRLEIGASQHKALLLATGHPGGGI